MLLSSYLQTDLGNTGTITNLLTGVSYVIIAFFFKMTQLVRLEYRDPSAILLCGSGLQRIMSIFNVPVLVQTSLDTLVTMVAVAVAVVLIRDSSIR